MLYTVFFSVVESIFCCLYWLLINYHYNWKNNLDLFLCMGGKNNNLSDKIDGPNDSRLKWRFLRIWFDGPPTITHGTATELLQTLKNHQSSMIEHIEQEISQKSLNESLSFKIGVYNHEVISESQLFIYDQEILTYFRGKWYKVSIDFNQPLTAWNATCPLHIKISSK